MGPYLCKLVNDIIIKDYQIWVTLWGFSGNFRISPMRNIKALNTAYFQVLSREIELLIYDRVCLFKKFGVVQFPAGISRHLTTQDLHSLQKCSGNTALTQSFFTFSPVKAYAQWKNVMKDCVSAVLPLHFCRL